MKIQAAIVMESKQPFVIKELELADPCEQEVLIKVVACGVCHTDEIGRIGGYITPFPAVFGHECSGIIEKVGPGVTDFKPGDSVLASYSYCGFCANCQNGKPYYCFDAIKRCFGGKMNDGTTRLSLDGTPVSTFFGQSAFATHAVVHVNNLINADPSYDLSMLGPLACGFMTGFGSVMNVLKPSVGSSLAVFGVGSVGLSAVMAAHIHNCSPLIAIDIFDNRLELAKQFGATHTINSNKVENVLKEIRKISEGGVEFATETTGIPEVINTMMMSLRMDGTAALVSNAHKVSEPALFGKHITGVLMGNAVPRKTIPKMIQFNKMGLFPFEKLISFYNLDDINQAFEDSHSGKTIKAIIKMP